MSFSEYLSHGPPVLIVSYNSAQFLPDCLESLEKQSLPPVEVWVVENNSSDNSLSLLRAWKKNKGKFIRNLLVLDQNYGFAIANNKILLDPNIITSPHVVLLNPDTVADSTWIESLVRSIQYRPYASAHASRIMMLNDCSTLDGAGDEYHLSGLARRRGHKKLYRPNQYHPPIFSACAAACAYRLDIFRKLNGFDESFFCYMEDVDLGFRMNLLGLQAFYSEDSVIHHMGGASSRDRLFATYHGHRNLEWVYIKNLPMPLLCLTFPIHLFMIFIIGLKTIAEGNVKVYFQAKFDALTSLGDVIKKRFSIQSQRKISLFQLLRKLVFIFH